MRYTASRALRIPTIAFAPSRHLTSLDPRLTTLSKQITQLPQCKPRRRYFHTSPIQHQSSSSPSRPANPNPTSNPHTNFYRTHGRALFKALTLAFFTYQVCYWAWLVLETEEIKDQKSREITRLEGEVKLLDEGRKRGLAAAAAAAAGGGGGGGGEKG